MKIKVTQILRTNILLLTFYNNLIELETNSRSLKIKAVKWSNLAKAISEDNGTKYSKVRTFLLSLKIMFFVKWFIHLSLLYVI